MRWIIGVLVVTLCFPVMAQRAGAQGTGVQGTGTQGAGRYQVTAASGEGNAPPTVVLVDTATGQSWVLVQTPGPPVQWAPVRFFTPGNPPTLAPTPPPVASVGSRPAEAAR